MNSIASWVKNISNAKHTSLVIVCVVLLQASGLLIIQTNVIPPAIGKVLIGTAWIIGFYLLMHAQSITIFLKSAAAAILTIPMFTVGLIFSVLFFDVLTYGIKPTFTTSLLKLLESSTGLIYLCLYAALPIVATAAALRILFWLITSFRQVK